MFTASFMILQGIYNGYYMILMATVFMIINFNETD